MTIPADIIAKARELGATRIATHPDFQGVNWYFLTDKPEDVGFCSHLGLAGWRTHWYAPGRPRPWDSTAGYTITPIDPPALRWATCPHCGSGDVCADATARWDAATDEWVLCTIHENFTCQACGRESNDVTYTEEEPDYA